MIKDAASAGFYESPNKKKYPRAQLLTIGGLLSKKQRAVQRPARSRENQF
jgi:hypothetical protein